MMEKEISSDKNWKETFCETALWQICLFISHRWNCLSITQFWNCIMNGFAKGHSGAHTGWWGNRRYLQITIGEKLSEKLLCDVCIPLRELYIFSHKAVFEHCSCQSEKEIFMVKIEISGNKTQKKAFQETVFWSVHSFQSVKAYSESLNLENVSLRKLRRDIKWHLEACGEKGNVFRGKLERNFQSNCLVMGAFIS